MHRPKKKLHYVVGNVLNLFNFVKGFYEKEYHAGCKSQHTTQLAASRLIAVSSELNKKVRI